MSPSSTADMHPWFALATRPRQEKLASKALSHLGYDPFQPTRTVQRRWSDRVKKCEDPLFPGYIFCRFDPLNRLPILTAPGVVSIVSFGKTLQPVEDSEIEAIQKLTSSGAPIYPLPFLQTGQRVRIEDGALAGLQGILTEVRNQRRVVVSVSLLQRSVAVEIDGARLSAL